MLSIALYIENVALYYEPDNENTIYNVLYGTLISSLGGLVG